MLRRLTAAGAAALLTLSLAACGNDKSDSDKDKSSSQDASASASPSTPTDDDLAAGDALAQVSVSEDTTKVPDVKFEGELKPEGIETQTITEGDGAEVAEGNTVLARIWVGNGTTKKGTFNGWDSPSPEMLPLTENLPAALRQGLTGAKVGSRVAIASTPEYAFGDAGNSGLGLAGPDAALFVVDVVSVLADGPQGADATIAKWAPKLVEADGKVTGFDFAAAPAPKGKLWVTKSIKGDGPVVTSGQTIYVNYLGQVYKGDKPFDESYSKGAPVSFQIGTGQVIKGWDQALVGQTVGSRVIMAIPPALGYGKTGQPDAGIKGTDTLYFVVDILGAS